MESFKLVLIGRAVDSEFTKEGINPARKDKYCPRKHFASASRGNIFTPRHIGKKEHFLVCIILSYINAQ